MLAKTHINAPNIKMYLKLTNTVLDSSQADMKKFPSIRTDCTYELKRMFLLAEIKHKNVCSTGANQIGLKIHPTLLLAMQTLLHVSVISTKVQEIMTCLRTIHPVCTAIIHASFL